MLDTSIGTVDSEVVPPDAPAVSLSDVRLHVQSIDYSDDALLSMWIGAATQIFEEYTGRQLVTATRELLLETWPITMSTAVLPYRAPRIELPRPPLQTVVSVSYLDSVGNVVSIAENASPELGFVIEAPQGTYARRGWVEPTGGGWPSGGTAPRVRYICGYGDTDQDVPDPIRAVICLLVAEFDQHRQVLEWGALPASLKMFIDAFKLSSLPAMRPRSNPYMWAW